MPKFKVYHRVITDVRVTVEADDEIAAMEQAAEDFPAGPCAQCSGWGRNWTRDEGDEPEVYEVTDMDGNVVWQANPDA